MLSMVERLLRESIMLTIANLNCGPYRFSIGFSKYDSTESFYTCDLELRSLDTVDGFSIFRRSERLYPKDIRKLISYINYYTATEDQASTDKKLNSYVPSELLFEFTIEERAIELMNHPDELYRIFEYSDAALEIRLMVRHKQDQEDGSFWYMGIQGAANVLNLVYFRNDLINGLKISENSEE